MRNRGRPGQARGRPETARRRARRQSESPDRANPVSWANPRFDVVPGIVGVSLSANRRAKAVPLGRCTGSPGKRYVVIHNLYTSVDGSPLHDRGSPRDSWSMIRKLAIYAIIRASTVAINSALQRSSSPPPISHRIAACRFCLGRLVSLDGRLALGVVGVWFRACG